MDVRAKPKTASVMAQTYAERVLDRSAVILPSLRGRELSKWGGTCKEWGGTYKAGRETCLGRKISRLGGYG